MKARELYDGSIKQLPEAERIQLAAMILNDIVSASPPDEEIGDWTDEELREWSNQSLQRFADEHGDEDA